MALAVGWGGVGRVGWGGGGCGCGRGRGRGVGGGKVGLVVVVEVVCACHLSTNEMLDQTHSANQNGARVTTDVDVTTVQLVGGVELVFFFVVPPQFASPQGETCGGTSSSQAHYTRGAMKATC